MMRALMVWSHVTCHIWTATHQEEACLQLDSKHSVEAVPQRAADSISPTYLQLPARQSRVLSEGASAEGLNPSERLVGISVEAVSLTADRCGRAPLTVPVPSLGRWSGVIIYTSMGLGELGCRQPPSWLREPQSKAVGGRPSWFLPLFLSEFLV